MSDRGIEQATKYLSLFAKIMASKNVIAPRGMEIREIEDLQLAVDPYCPFMTFAARRYDVNYFKHEMMWKLGANKYDDSIKQHAKMWESVQNPSGTFNSNYGQYWFGEQNGMWNVITELVRDPDSRRAVIPMLSKEHMTPETKDTVCTEAVGFRIRKNVAGSYCLNMSVHMRSSDAVFGLGTDIPTFAFLYRLVFAIMSSVLDCNLYSGVMTITAMSSHIYSRHYQMVDQILLDGIEYYEPMTMPWCDYREAVKIVSSRGKLNATFGPLSKWMLK